MKVELPIKLIDITCLPDKSEDVPIKAKSFRKWLDYSFNMQGRKQKKMNPFLQGAHTNWQWKQEQCALLYCRREGTDAAAQPSGWRCTGFVSPQQKTYYARVAPCLQCGQKIPAEM